MISVETMNIFNKILDFSEESRKYGLLALEKFCNKIDCLDNKLLELLVLYVVDGMDSDMINQIVNNYIEAANYQGEELAQAKMIRDGMLYVQSGENSFVVAELMCSHFDIKERDNFTQACKIKIRALG